MDWKEPTDGGNATAYKVQRRAEDAEGMDGCGQAVMGLSTNSTVTQPGKSRTNKADEIYRFLSFSSFLIVLFRIFRESE
uniref:Uncharacterized protein n=1 Tax=Candidatus Kentrum sp. LPFa TaxID=2126335 RepID=A0A450WTZ3_9GAMM|nr:MAG: hypothetical protein BECKLPF1236B_GA0070989_12134 [Candidatus Kentron sp. LPFa]